MQPLALSKQWNLCITVREERLCVPLHERIHKETLPNKEEKFSLLLRYQNINEKINPRPEVHFS